MFRNDNDKAMNLLYITGDQIGISTGGGAVTRNESQALASIGKCEAWGWERIRLELRGTEGDPWDRDLGALGFLSHNMDRLHRYSDRLRLVHFYAGTFTETIRKLKLDGIKVTYTAAAHDINLSRQEHHRLGIPFNYPHLNEPDLWKRYVGGYLAADVLIVPSQHSKTVMQTYGAQNRVEVIQHGVDLPEKVVAPPSRFVVGYLGSATAPDKGVIYLLQAWKKLAYNDAMLVIAGRDSTSPFMAELVSRFGGGNICLSGWVENVSDFYNLISLLVQPSVTEGFGLEILEAMAHARPVLCSTGAGAADVVPEVYRFPACDVDELAEKIDLLKKTTVSSGELGNEFRKLAENYTWDKIRARYVEVWKGLI